MGLIGCPALLKLSHKTNQFDSGSDPGRKQARIHKQDTLALIDNAGAKTYQQLDNKSPPHELIHSQIYSFTFCKYGNILLLLLLPRVTGICVKTLALQRHFLCGDFKSRG
jgi:hypothetical protein